MLDDILEGVDSFDWDDWNSKKIFNKHNVSTTEAEEIFVNEPVFFFRDEKHSMSELRYGAFGITNKGRKLSCVFTIRGNKIRVITCRNMSKKERVWYEKQNKTK